MTRRAAWLLYVLGAVPLTTGAIEFACPKKIVTEQTLAVQERGWSAFVRPDGQQGKAHAAHVRGIEIYDGDPSELVQLKPDDELAKDARWSFIQPAPADRPIHMACTYFDTRIQFVRALPLDVKTCRALRGGILRCEQFRP